MESEHILSRLKCPVCNSDNFKSIFKRRYDETLISKYMEVAYQGNADTRFLRGIDFEIVKCRKCHFAFQKSVPKDHKLSELYNEWIDPKLVDRVAK